MSLNYDILTTLKLLHNSFKYDIFIAIIISSILFTILLIINKNNKIMNYFICLINVILISIICFFYIKKILTFKFNNPINNIYFYFFNTILYLIISSIIIFKTKYKKINFIFYGLSLINILFSIFMTINLENVSLIVLYNIFPMIKFGNIIYILYYVFIISTKFLTKKS